MRDEEIILLIGALWSVVLLIATVNTAINTKKISTLIQGQEKRMQAQEERWVRLHNEKQEKEIR